MLAALLLAKAATALEIPYEVEITGIEDEKLLEAVRENSALVADAERPPPTTAALRRRVEADLPQLEAVLDSFGYYGAQISYEIGDYEVATEATPARVTLLVTPGPLYRIGDYNVIGPSPALSDGSVHVDAAALGVTRGAPAEARAIVQSQARLLGVFARQAHPLARITGQNIVVDHAAQSVAVNLTVDLGPEAKFGEVTIEGLETVGRDFVLARLPWRYGAPFDADLVDQARRALRETGLFASVAIELADAVDAEGRLPIIVRLAEAKHRSVGAGLAWSTSDGFGAKVFWEHRNLFGTGEQFNATALGGEAVNGVEANLRAPGLPDPRFTYVAAARVRDENRDAYDSQTAGVSIGVEYAVTPILTVAAGGSLEYEDITDSDDSSKFTLVGLPLSLTRDTSDDLFDPTRGNRLTVSVTPYVSLLGDSTQFVATRLADAQYLSLTDDDSLILAGWGRIGSIFGDEGADIPATKRLYGGGGGSVRAFGYQMLGPLDTDGDPLGGRSQVELGAELRARVTEDFGGVIFVEGGNVYEDPVPDFDEEFLWGAGFGLRYYTDFGPIRLDLAFPVNPRSEDDWFQLYVSLGQAF
jgi:translocation and assembly module TamA